MTMSMRRAFNAKMLVTVTWYQVSVGSYDDDNLWVSGGNAPKDISARVIAGNKFSQFEEGISRTVEDGGTRNRDYISLYVLADDPVAMNDKIGWNGKYYNILQISDEAHFGFKSAIAEKSEGWTP